ncbi:hypothetical protein SELMODRAFT_421531 [Selaginella moellendorffii]|uniref:C2H2-type domain-containing protein n=1 Tax=Selaginella moellendorffii TaxID=88036 RepID=D8SFK3_SELML|nr:uncharacterized protein LOC9635626 [Selaginella moellendorffii]EFJ16854.1 hypothetical protein SELMODRAFT_421531 [Selaginella moellendorffii]|eukprot:XP_002982186.1 uncharacterized protein LOC9635626 [Selaginella moellendorffii]
MDFEHDVEVEAMEKSDDFVITIPEGDGSYDEQEVDVEQDIGLAEVLESPGAGAVDSEKAASSVKGFDDEKKVKTSNSTTQCNIVPSVEEGGGSNASKGVGKAYRKRSDSAEAKRKESEVTGHRGDKSAKSFKSDDAGNKERGFHLSDVFKGSENLAKGFQASDRLHSLKVPQAVVAFAQAAAKVNEIPGWPLLPKPQMKKCEKCSREFCSTLNYRRHIRSHRRSLIDDKDLRHERSQLAAYWDKLTAEESSEVISFKNMGIENLSGTSAFQALASFVQHPGLQPYPPAYMKAGTVLLELVQNKTSLFPIPSEKLLKTLDDASEGTFLCGGTSIAVQRFVYHGDAEKIGLEDKNVVASMSFLVEQKLLKAWMAEKNVEALRCEKALVEEEEAAQRKRAKDLERKRQKRNKQKGRKGVDQPPNADIDLGDEEVNTPRTGDDEDYPFAVDNGEGPVTEVTDENGFLVLLRDNQAATWETSSEEKTVMENSIEMVHEEDQGQVETALKDHNFVDQNIGRVIKDRRRTNFSSSATYRTGDSSYQAYFRPRRTQHSTRIDPYQQHYRKKLAGVYRGIVKGSNGRVVWTRKASQPSRTKDDDQEISVPVGSAEAESGHTLLVGSLSVPLEGHVRRPCSLSEESNLMNKSSTPESLEGRQASWAKPTPPLKVWKPVGKVGDQSGAENTRSMVEDDGTFPPKLSAVALRPAVDSDNAEDGAAMDTKPCLVDLHATSPSFSSKLLASFLSERWATAVERRNTDANFKHDRTGKRSKNTKVWPINNDQNLDTEAPKLSPKGSPSGVLDEAAKANEVLDNRPRNFVGNSCGKAVGRWQRNSKDKPGEQRYMPRQISLA